MLFFIKLGGVKQGVLAGGLTLALMVLPTVMANTRESLLAVPRAYREGALALGSGKWHMVRTVVLPNAVDGIVTGCILSVGRITGESAALLFTAGCGCWDSRRRSNPPRRRFPWRCISTQASRASLISPSASRRCCSC